MGSLQEANPTAPVSCSVPYMQRQQPHLAVIENRYRKHRIHAKEAQKPTREK